ncbi:aminoglycoside phosphotransferase family protein [Sansalvadorimonas verongulae]|uniref:aminoglycoside phosphotransferase family protein n=1 Tax=Sansalvadorimonas verongulae TaxID=2172824 RepID=UPI0018AD2147|nr:phosphotransferase [Sansalvadorimonas verongulae]
MESNPTLSGTNTDDDRYSELDNWCSEQLSITLGRSKSTALESVSGDASFRRYFRAQTANNTSFIAVDAPPEHEDCKRFTSIARSWRAQGVRTPAVHSVDVGRGYMLLEDFGDQLLYSSLDQYRVEGRRVDKLYVSAMASLLALQSTHVPEDYPLPTYNAERLQAEMSLFSQWCLQTLLQMELGDDEQALLNELFDKITVSALEQPTVPVHRDYHSRNIMMLPDGLGLIDFQDAVLGPVTYDPVSLLRDCYIDWPQSQVYQWLDKFAGQSPHLQGVEKEKLYQWFDWMGAQRHIKVLGIFIRLWQRDGKTGYLNDIPRVFAYLQWVCERYSELADAGQWLKEEVAPRLGKQSWWQDYRLVN